MMDFTTNTKFFYPTRLEGFDPKSPIFYPNWDQYLWCTYFPGSCHTVHLDPLQCVCPVQGLATPQAFTSTASTGSCSTCVYPSRMSIFVILIRLMMTGEIVILIGAKFIKLQNTNQSVPVLTWSTRWIEYLVNPAAAIPTHLCPPSPLLILL